MKNHYVRISVLLGINILVNYLLLYPLGLIDYVQTSNLYLFGLVGILISGITLAITLLFMKFADRKPVRSLNFSFGKKQRLYAVLSIALTVGIYMGFYSIMAGLDLAVFQFNSDYFSNGRLIPMFLIVALSWMVAAFYEEVLFRGYLVLNLKHLSVRKLFLVTSIIFAIVHLLRGYDLISLLIIMIHGILFLYIYLKTGSILAVTVTHFISNFTNGHLVGNAEISIMQITQAPADAFGLVPYALELVLHLVLVKVMFRENRLRQAEGEYITKISGL